MVGSTPYFNRVQWRHKLRIDVSPGFICALSFVMFHHTRLFIDANQTARPTEEREFFGNSQNETPARARNGNNLRSTTTAATGDKLLIKPSRGAYASR